MLKPTDLFNPPPIGCVLSLSGKPQGGTNLWDSSPYGNHGTIYGATWVRLPSGLWCLSYDGVDDYVDCGSGNGLKLISSLSLTAWIKKASPWNGSHAHYHQIISKDSIYDNGYGLTVYERSVDTSVKFTIWIRSGDVFTNAEYYLPQAQWSISAFAFFGGVFNDEANELKVYLNGELKATLSEVTITPADTDFPLYIGWSRRKTEVDSNKPFDGLIAKACIYNRALSALEIQNRYNQTKHLFRE